MLKHMHKLFSKSENVTYYLLILTLIFVPLYMKFPLLGISKTFVSIRLEDVLILATFLSWLVSLAFKKKIPSLFKSDIFFGLFVFFLIGAFSSVSAYWLTKTVYLNLAILHLLRRFELMILMPISYTVIKGLGSRKKVIALLLMVAFIVNLYAVGQRWFSFPAVSTTNSELSKGKVYFLTAEDRISSTFAGHYDLAIFEMMIVCISVPLVIYLIRRREIIQSIFVAANCAFSFAILIMTAARFSFLAVFVGVTVGFLLIGKKRYLLALVLLFASMMLYPSQLRDRIVSTVKVNLLGSFSSFTATTEQQERRGLLNIPTLPAGEEENKVEGGIPDIVPGEPTESVDLGVYRSLSIRLNIEWPRALRAFYKNPFYGTGYSSLGLATDNDFLRMLGEVGLFGTVSFLLLLTMIIKKLWYRFRNSSGFDKYLLVGILSMLVAFLANAVFIDVFEASKTAAIFWMIIGVGISVNRKIAMKGVTK